ncbi:MAG: SPOR domain-containing protein, partial [Pseudomonadales bacterium]|nr:SPOR domain-containing protein [Pseudomonadales bacterium]
AKTETTASRSDRRQRVLAQKTGTDGEPSPLRKKFLDGTRYEVQIKPPPRPEPQAVEGSGERARAASAALGTGAGTQQAGTGPGSTTPLPAPTLSTSRVDPGAGPSFAAPANPVPVPAMPSGTAALTAPQAALPTPATGELSLQVGAFREIASAIELKTKLLRSFDDVYVSRIESGGEPLYRVRVGRFADRDASMSTKVRLQAAGHPSFTVRGP